MFITRPWIDVQALAKGIFHHIKEHWVISSADKTILQDALRSINVEPKVIYPPYGKPRETKLQNWIYVNDRELLEHLCIAMPDIEFRNNKSSGIPKLSIHFQDRPSNIIRSAAEGSEVISEIYLPHLRYLQCDNLPEIQRQLVHTIRQLNRDGIEKNKEVMSYYQPSQYFANKLKKYLTVPQRKGRLEEVLDTMPAQSVLKS